MEYREPIIGENIYVPTSLYIGHGEDDFIGGLATINEIFKSDNLPENHINYIMVSINERPRYKYNWRDLLEQQEELKELFGNQKAYPDPDYYSNFDHLF